MSVENTYIPAYQARTAGRIPVYGPTGATSSDPKEFKGMMLNEMSQKTTDHAPYSARNAASNIKDTPSSQDGKTQARIESTLSQKGQETSSEEKKSWSFWDFLDVINPLHHIPGVGTLYREITGDEIGNTARIIGGAIYGGAVGAAAGIANVAIAEATGKDIGEHMVAFVQNKDDITHAQAKGDMKTQTSNQAIFLEKDITWHTNPALGQDTEISTRSPLPEAPTPTTPNRTLAAGTTKPTPQHTVSVDSPPGLLSTMTDGSTSTSAMGEEIASHDVQTSIPATKEAWTRTEEIGSRSELSAKMDLAMQKYAALKIQQMQ